MGAKFVTQVAGDKLIASLIAGVAGRGHNVVAIADLWGKLLSRLREELNIDGAVARGSSKQVKQKSKNRQASGDCDGGRSNADQKDRAVLDLSFTPEWVALWAPQLSLALVSGPLNGRKQVAALCIPLIVNAVGGPASRFDASIAFSILLDEVQLLVDTENAGESLESYAGETETFSDRVLWAKFEVIRYRLARLQHVMSLTFSFSILSICSDRTTSVETKSVENGLEYASFVANCYKISATLCVGIDADAFVGIDTSGRVCFN